MVIGVFYLHTFSSKILYYSEALFTKNEPIAKNYRLYGQKRTSCNNSAAGLLQACERFGRVDGILAVEFEFTVS